MRLLKAVVDQGTDVNSILQRRICLLNVVLKHKNIQIPEVTILIPEETILTTEETILTQEGIILEIGVTTQLIGAGLQAQISPIATAVTGARMAHRIPVVLQASNNDDHVPVLKIAPVLSAMVWDISYMNAQVPIGTNMMARLKRKEINYS